MEDGPQNIKYHTGKLNMSRERNLLSKITNL